MDAKGEWNGGNTRYIGGYANGTDARPHEGGQVRRDKGPSENLLGRARNVEKDQFAESTKEVETIEVQGARQCADAMWASQDWLGENVTTLLSPPINFKNFCEGKRPG